MRSRGSVRRAGARRRQRRRAGGCARRRAVLALLWPPGWPGGLLAASTALVDSFGASLFLLGASTRGGGGGGRPGGAPPGRDLALFLAFRLARRLPGGLHGPRRPFFSFPVASGRRHAQWWRRRAARGGAPRQGVLAFLWSVIGCGSCSWPHGRSRRWSAATAAPRSFSFRREPRSSSCSYRSGCQPPSSC